MSTEESLDVQLELEDVLKRLERRKALLKVELKTVARSSSMKQYLQKSNVGGKFNEPLGKPRAPKKVLVPEHIGPELDSLEAGQKRLRADGSHREDTQAPHTSKKPINGKKNKGNSKKSQRPAESQKTYQINNKSEVPERFWKTVEPYAGRITQENVDFLQHLVKGNEYSEQLLKFAAVMKKYREMRRNGCDLSLNNDDDDDGVEDPPLTETEQELVKRMGITTEAYNRVRRVTQCSANAHLAQQSTNKMNGSATDSPIAMHTRAAHSSGSQKLFKTTDLETRPKTPTNGDAAISENVDPDEDSDLRFQLRKLGVLQKTNEKWLEYAQKHTAIQLEKQEIYERLDEIDEELNKACDDKDKNSEERLRQERRKLMQGMRRNHEESMHINIFGTAASVPEEECAAVDLSE